MAIEYGCWFSIDSDAHATGQLEWQPHGCDRAAEREVPIERIINTMSADDLLAWTADGNHVCVALPVTRLTETATQTGWCWLQDIQDIRAPYAARRRPAPRVSPVVPSPILFIT